MGTAFWVVAHYGAGLGLTCLNPALCYWGRRERGKAKGLIIMRDNSFLFQLKIKVYKDEPLIIINAFERNQFSPTGHNYFEVEVKQGEKVIFPRGQLYGGVNQWTAVDSDSAKALAISLVGMKPGDTDLEFFKDYTPEQIEWVKKYGEALSIEAEDRYGEV